MEKILFLIIILIIIYFTFLNQKIDEFSALPFNVPLDVLFNQSDILKNLNLDNLITSFLLRYNKDIESEEIKKMYEINLLTQSENFKKNKNQQEEQLANIMKNYNTNIKNINFKYNEKKVKIFNLNNQIKKLEKKNNQLSQQSNNLPPFSNEKKRLDNLQKMNNNIINNLKNDIILLLQKY